MAYYLWDIIFKQWSRKFMVQSSEPRLIRRKMLMNNVIVGIKYCLWEKQTEKGLWEQVVSINSIKDNTAG